jgi:hypothetical protein
MVCSWVVTVFQMAMALGATGYFMAIDVPITPRAVVGCVIVYNAFFGYRYTRPLQVTGRFTKKRSQLGTDPVALPARDHASYCSGEGRFVIDCNELVLQFHRGTRHTIPARCH